MAALTEYIERFILDPQNKDILALVKAFRNGAVYGTKVRFPHALVMIFLFRSGTAREKIRLVFKATRTHARNLAVFALTYKTVALVLRRLPFDPYFSLGPAAPKNGEGRPMDDFVAGLVGGYYVFGRGSQSSVNQQIVTYVFARVALGLAKLLVQSPDPNVAGGVKGLIPDPHGTIRNHSWPIFASVSWGMVMYLFQWHPEVLQSSMRSSMVYIYSNADKWDSIRNFLIHNK